MSSAEIISLIVTIIGVFSFATIFTILYKSYATSQIAEIKSGKKDIEIIDEVIYERQEHIKRRRKINSVIRNVIFYLTLVIIIPLFIFSLINRFQHNVTMIGNKTIMVVASGSMSEKNKANSYLITNDTNSKLNYQFQTYDIIVLEKVEKASDLSRYDVIAFVNDDGINVIHRIKDIIGRYTGKKINGLGMFIMFLQSYAGIITIVSLIYCLFMIDYLSRKMNQAQENRSKQLAEAIDYSHEVELKALKAEYVETIYYKGYAYRFGEDGFVDKTEIKDGPYLEKSNETIIKEVQNKTTSEKIAEEIVIKDDKSGE